VASFRDLTDAAKANIIEGAKSYLVPAASPEQHAEGIALMLAELRSYGVDLTPRDLYEILPEPLRTVFLACMPLLDDRALEQGRRNAERWEAAEEEAAARFREQQIARLAKPITDWQLPDRATADESHKIRRKRKLGLPITAEEARREQAYEEHRREFVRARRLYLRLPPRQQRELRNWTPRQFLAHQRCARIPRASYVARPRAQQTRRTAAPTRDSPSPGEDDPEPPPVAWAFLALASERMHVHERRREARWRKRVTA
jgi:hypothetical protein